MKHFERIAALGTICILIAALSFTFNHWTAFEMKILKAPFIPVMLIQPLTYLIPLLEILIIALLLIPRQAINGWKLNLGLQILLSGYLLLLISESSGPPCGCGGIFPMLDIHQHLYLQFFLFIASIIFIVMDQSHIDPRPVTTFKLFSFKNLISSDESSRH